MDYTQLEKIYYLIEEELSQFEDSYANILKSEVSLIDRIGRYISNTKGKRIRPAILLLSAKYFGEINEYVINAASIVELLHTATLIHDDVIDKADQRRGKNSINNKWENKIAVLMGDFLFSRSLNKLVDLKDLDIMSNISRTTEHLTSGELLQIEKSQENEMTEEIYYEMIFYKTASLFATSCEIGAKLMSAAQEKCQPLYDYGKYLGMAFQIKDDLFDIAGKSESTGKPIGQDVKQNILTLPIIYTLNNLPGKDTKKVNKILEEKSKTSSDRLKKYVSEAGGFQYCREKVDDYSKKALKALEKLEQNEITDSLNNLVKYNIDRKK